jgi:hypothetical protein
MRSNPRPSTWTVRSSWSASDRPGVVQRSLGWSSSRTRRRPCRVSARERSSTSRSSSARMRTQYGATRLAHASPSGREQVPCARRIGEQTGEQPAVWLVLHGFPAPVELAWYLRRVSGADLRQLAPETWPGGPRRRGQEVRHIAAARQRGQQRRQVEPGRTPPDKQQPSPGTGPADRRPPRAAGDQRRLRPPRLRPARTSCAQDSQICTAFVLIGAKPTSAQIGGSRVPCDPDAVTVCDETAAVQAGHVSGGQMPGRALGP